MQVLLTENFMSIFLAKKAGLIIEEKSNTILAVKHSLYYAKDRFNPKVHT
jgi:hypothetical protein